MNNNIENKAIEQRKGKDSNHIYMEVRDFILEDKNQSENIKDLGDYLNNIPDREYNEIKQTLQLIMEDPEIVNLFESVEKKVKENKDLTDDEKSIMYLSAVLFGKGDGFKNIGKFDLKLPIEKICDGQLLAYIQKRYNNYSYDPSKGKEDKRPTAENAKDRGKGYKNPNMPKLHPEEKDAEEELKSAYQGLPQIPLLRGKEYVHEYCNKILKWAEENGYLTNVEYESRLRNEFRQHYEGDFEYSDFDNEHSTPELVYDKDYEAYVKYDKLLFAFGKYCEVINKKHEELVKKAGYWDLDEFAEEMKYIDGIQEYLKSKYPDLDEAIERVNPYLKEMEENRKKYFGGKTEEEVEKAGKEFEEYKKYEEKKIEEYGITEETIKSLCETPKDEKELETYLKNLNAYIGYQYDVEGKKKEYGEDIDTYMGYIKGIQAIRGKYGETGLDSDLEMIKGYMDELNSAGKMYKPKGQEVGRVPGALTIFDKFNKYSELISADPELSKDLKNMKTINEVLSDPTSEDFWIEEVKKEKTEEKKRQEKRDRRWNNWYENYPVWYELLSTGASIWNTFINFTVGTGTSLGAMICGLILGKEHYQSSLQRKERWDSSLTIGVTKEQQEGIYDSETGKITLNWKNGPYMLASSVTNMYLLILGGGAMGEGIGKILGKKGLEIAGKAGLFSMSFIMQAGQSYTEAMNAGLEGNGAFIYSMLTATAQSSLELVSPNEVLLGKGRGVGKEMVRAMCKGGNKGGIKLAGKYFLKTMFREMGEEIMQEEMQLAAGNLINDFYNGIRNTDFESDWGYKNFLATAMITAMTTGIATGISSGGTTMQIMRGKNNKLIEKIFTTEGLYEDVMKVLDNAIKGEQKIPDVKIEQLEELKMMLNHIHDNQTSTENHTEIMTKETERIKTEKIGKWNNESNNVQSSKETEQQLLIEGLGKIFHEQRRNSMQKPDGSIESRIETVTDLKRIQEHNGQTEIDILNTEFDDLPAEWKKENLEAAKVAVDLVYNRVTNGEKFTIDIIEEMASIVHDKRLERNGINGSFENQRVSYSQLSEKEKAKDRNQVIRAIQATQQNLFLNNITINQNILLKSEELNNIEELKNLGLTIDEIINLKKIQKLGVVIYENDIDNLKGMELTDEETENIKMVANAFKELGLPVDSGSIDALKTFTAKDIENVRILNSLGVHIDMSYINNLKGLTEQDMKNIIDLDKIGIKAYIVPILNVKGLKKSDIDNIKKLLENLEIEIDFNNIQKFKGLTENDITNIITLNNKIGIDVYDAYIDVVKGLSNQDMLNIQSLNNIFSTMYISDIVYIKELSEKEMENVIKLNELGICVNFKDIPLVKGLNITESEFDNLENLMNLRIIIYPNDITKMKGVKSTDIPNNVKCLAKSGFRISSSILFDIWNATEDDIKNIIDLENYIHYERDILDLIGLSEDDIQNIKKYSGKSNNINTLKSIRYNIDILEADNNGNYLGGYEYSDQEIDTHILYTRGAIIETIQQNIQKIIGENRDITALEIINVIRPSLVTLNQKERLQILSTIYQIVDKFNTIRKYLDFENGPYRTPKELLCAIRGFTTPNIIGNIKDNITVRQHGSGLVFFVGDERSYQIIHDKNLEDSEKRSGGFNDNQSSIEELSGSLSVVNGNDPGIEGDNYENGTIRHEGQHNRNSYFMSDKNGTPITRAKDEITALLRDGRGIFDVEKRDSTIEDILTKSKSEGGLYQYGLEGEDREKHKEYVRQLLSYANDLIELTKDPKTGLKREKVISMLADCSADSRDYLHALITESVQIHIERDISKTKIEKLKERFTEKIKERAGNNRLINNLIEFWNSIFPDYGIKLEEFRWAGTAKKETAINEIENCNSIEEIKHVLNDPKYSHIGWGQDNLGGIEVSKIIDDGSSTDNIPDELKPYIQKVNSKRNKSGKLTIPEGKFNAPNENFPETDDAFRGLVANNIDQIIELDRIQDIDTFIQKSFEFLKGKMGLNPDIELEITDNENYYDIETNTVYFSRNRTGKERKHVSGQGNKAEIFGGLAHELNHYLQRKEFILNLDYESKNWVNIINKLVSLQNAKANIEYIINNYPDNLELQEYFEKAKEYGDNRSNYINPESDYEGYKNQTVEDESFRRGNIVIEEYKKATTKNQTNSRIDSEEDKEQENGQKKDLKSEESNKPKEKQKKRNQNYFDGQSHEFEVTQEQAIENSQYMDNALEKVINETDEGKLQELLNDIKNHIEEQYEKTTGQKLNLSEDQVWSILDAHSEDGALGKLNKTQLSKRSDH